MTQEEKQLLFKDLCARLPYGVVMHTDWKDVKLDHDHCGIGMLYYDHYSEEAKKEFGIDENDCSIIISGCYYGDIKPYLRPMSSMTEEEEIYYNTIYTTLKFYEKEDWLNEHHFDYRGLIPMGLAIEATEEMYS
jgi:hypothetical protein